MNICTLEYFITKIEKSRYQIDSKDRIIVYKGIDPIRITENHIIISKISYEEFDQTGINVLVDFSSSDGTIKDGIEIHRAYKGQRITCKWNELFDAIKATIKKKEYETKICNLYRKYFCYCVREYIAHNPSVLADCGWINDDDKRIFLSINSSYDNSKAIEKDFFDGNKNPEIFTQEMKIDGFNKLFEFILTNKCTLTSFAYCIHAILWDYIHEHSAINEIDDRLNEDTINFSLCLYGNDSAVSKTLANLLLNLFTIKYKSWTIIDHKYHVSATSLSDKRYNDLRKYRNIPIIITSKDNRITKANSIVKKIQRLRNDRALFISPVYISKMPINADEMVNCCTDSLIDKMSISDYEWLHDIHRKFCILVCQFIQFLTDVSHNYKYPPLEKNIIENALYNNLANEAFSAEWLDYHTPEILLYTTMQCFCRFLFYSPLKDYHKRMEDEYKKCFLDEPQPPLPQTPVPENTALQDFRSFIHESLKIKANHEWIFEGEEAQGNEQCYYFYPKIGYDKYVRFLEKNHRPIVSKQALARHLKNNDILKLPKSGTSNTMKRTGIYVYVIKRHSLEKI